MKQLIRKFSDIVIRKSQNFKSFQSSDLLGEVSEQVIVGAKLPKRSYPAYTGRKFLDLVVPYVYYSEVLASLK